MKTLLAVACLMLTVGIADAQRMVCKNGRCTILNDGFSPDIYTSMEAPLEPPIVNGRAVVPPGYHAHYDPIAREAWEHSDSNVGNRSEHYSPYTGAYVTRRMPESRRYSAAPVAFAAPTGGCVGSQSRAVYQQSPYQQVSYVVAQPQLQYSPVQQQQYVVQQQQQLFAAPTSGCIGNKRTAQYAVPQMQSYTVTIPAKQVTVTIPEDQVTVQLPQPQIEVIPQPQLEQSVVVQQPQLVAPQLSLAPQVATVPCPCDQQVVVQQQATVQYVDPCYQQQEQFSPYAFEGVDPGDSAFDRTGRVGGIDVFDSNVNIMQRRARCALFQRLREGRATRLSARADRVSSRVVGIYNPVY